MKKNAAILNNIKIFLLVVAQLNLFGSSIQAQATIKGEPMLERKLAYPDSTIYLPYTSLCLIHNAELPSNSGWLLESDIQKSKKRSLLIVEMNSSEILGFKYASGSVQFVVEVPNFTGCFEFDMNSDKIKIHCINNYGGLMSTDEKPKGKLTLKKVENEIILSGNVILKRSNPATKQVLGFNNNYIPEFDLNEYLLIVNEKEKKHENDLEKIAEDLASVLLEEYNTPVESLEQPKDNTEDKKTPGQGFKLSYSIFGLGSN